MGKYMNICFNVFDEHINVRIFVISEYVHILVVMKLLDIYICMHSAYVDYKYICAFDTCS